MDWDKIIENSNAFLDLRERGNTLVAEYMSLLSKIEEEHDIFAKIELQKHAMLVASEAKRFLEESQRIERGVIAMLNENNERSATS